MTDRKNIFDNLKLKMEEVGFQFEREQKPHLQNRKETELKFIHPQLIKKLEEDGYKANAKKFYVKPLSDEPNCEIGFVTGKTSPLFEAPFFSKPNSVDSFDNTAAWTNREGDYIFAFAGILPYPKAMPVARLKFFIKYNFCLLLYISNWLTKNLIILFDLFLTSEILLI